MIILASTSPRRAKLLEEAGVKFEIRPSYFDESLIKASKYKPAEYVMALSKAKASEVSETASDGDIIIGADTAVFLGDEMFGKPKNEEDAYNMIKKLAGKKHDVITGVSIIKKDVINGNKEEVFFSKAQVVIRNMTDFEIKNYIEVENPLDKAGAYAIQEDKFKIVESYKGDFLSIVGLPLLEVLKKISILEEE